MSDSYVSLDTTTFFDGVAQIRAATVDGAGPMTPASVGHTAADETLALLATKTAAARDALSAQVEMSANELTGAALDAVAADEGRQLHLPVAVRRLTSLRRWRR